MPTLEVPSTALQALENMGTELKCPICLSIFREPPIRTPCCHYFCPGCLTQHLKAKKECPTCKQPVKISRGQEGDAKLHRISQHYAMLEALTGHQEHCSQLPELRTPDRARNDLVQDAARERLLMQGRRGATLGIRCKRQSVASSAKSASRSHDKFGPLPLRRSNSPGAPQEAGDADAPPPDMDMAGGADDEAEPPMATAADPAALAAVLCTPGEDIELTTPPAKEGAGTQAKGGAKGRPSAAPPNAADEAAGRKKAQGDATKRQSDPYNYTGSGHAQRDEGGERAPLADALEAGVSDAGAESKGAATAPRGMGAAAARRAAKRASMPPRGAPAVADAAPTPATERRGSARHAPWACSACTFENEAKAKECRVCRVPRGADQPPEEVVLKQKALEEQIDPILTASQSTRDGAAETGVGAKSRGGKKRKGGADQGDEDGVATGRAGGAKSGAKRGAGAGPSGVGTDKEARASKKPRGGSKGARGTANATPEQASEGIADGDGGATFLARLEEAGSEGAEGGKGAKGAGRGQGGKKAAGKAAGGARGRMASLGWRITGSGLSGKERGSLEALAKRLGCVYVDEWDAGVTHVVCGVDGQGAAKRTAKYALGLLSGAWVLTPEWVQATSKAGAPQDESAFFVKGDTEGSFGAAESARTGEGPSEGCLRGRGVYVLGEFKTGPVMNRNVKAIVELLGGEVLSVAPGAGTDAVVVCDPDNLRTRDQTTIGELSAQGVPVVSYRWLLASAVDRAQAPVKDFAF